MALKAIKFENMVNDIVHNDSGIDTIEKLKKEVDNLEYDHRIYTLLKERKHGSKSGSE